MIANSMFNGLTQAPTGQALCNTGFQYDSSLPISVLVISSGSAGTICVSYSNAFNNEVSGPTYISVYQYNITGKYESCPCYTLNDVTSKFLVTSSPDAMTLTNPNQKETVTYSISIPSTVKSGIFGIFLSQFCSLFPMVIIPNGDSHVLLTRWDFSSWYPHTGSCPAQVVSSEVLGVGGFQVAKIWLATWTGVEPSQSSS